MMLRKGKERRKNYTFPRVGPTGLALLPVFILRIACSFWSNILLQFPAKHPVIPVVVCQEARNHNFPFWKSIRIGLLMPVRFGVCSCRIASQLGHKPILSMKIQTYSLFAGVRVEVKVL